MPRAPKRSKSPPRLAPAPPAEDGALASLTLHAEDGVEEPLLPGHRPRELRTRIALPPHSRWVTVTAAAASPHASCRIYRWDETATDDARFAVELLMLTERRRLAPVATRADGAKQLRAVLLIQAAARGWAVRRRKQTLGNARPHAAPITSGLRSAINRGQHKKAEALARAAFGRWQDAKQMHAEAAAYAAAHTPTAQDRRAVLLTEPSTTGPDPIEAVAPPLLGFLRSNLLVLDRVLRPRASSEEDGPGSGGVDADGTSGSSGGVRGCDADGRIDTDAFEAALRLLGLPKELDTEQHFERLYAALCVRAPTVHGRKMRYADLAKFLLSLEGTFAQV